MSDNNTVSTINSGDTAWVLVSTAMVMLMIPGLGYFYSGLARHKNALSLIFLSVISLAIVSFQWFLFGFSLSFSGTSSFIGDFKHAGLSGVFNANQTFHMEDIKNIPGSVFMIYQCMFAAITPALAFGSGAERSRIIPCIIFIFLWTTFVYDFIAYWSWSKYGWARALGSLDFAGGTPVHIASGAAGLAYAIVTGKRTGFGKGSFKPHSASSVFLGTALLWFGWFGFNGGSELAANDRAVLAVVNSNIAASIAGITWVFLDYRHNKKFSSFAFCTGAVAGLVAITPGCGYVAPWAAVIIGVCGTCACNLFMNFKHLYFFDDALDVFGVHGVGGLVGNLLAGVFASKTLTSMDSTEIKGGWVDGHYMQILYQLAASVAGMTWSFVITFIMLKCMNSISILRLRLNEKDENLGVDLSQLGDRVLGSYSPDYIESQVGLALENLSMEEKHLEEGTGKDLLMPQI
jgi:Amt family ammonium transporter